MRSFIWFAWQQSALTFLGFNGALHTEHWSRPLQSGSTFENCISAVWSAHTMRIKWLPLARNHLYALNAATRVWHVFHTHYTVNLVDTDPGNLDQCGLSVHVGHPNITFCWLPPFYTSMQLYLEHSILKTQHPNLLPNQTLNVCTCTNRGYPPINLDVPENRIQK